jgi:hypothetical protein
MGFCASEEWAKPCVVEGSFSWVGFLPSLRLAVSISLEMVCGEAEGNEASSLLEEGLCPRP